MHGMRNIMTHTNLLTTLEWGKGRLRSVGSKAEAYILPENEDSRQALNVKDLDPEWIHALESADYGHLESKPKKLLA